MADLFLQIGISLDGYIEDAGRDIEWMTSDLSMDRFATETLRSVDGMIFGRRAHELLAKFWPDAGSNNGASEDLIEQARLMNALPKYVLTHQAERTGWANSHAIRLDDIPQLKRQARRPIALFAGASATQAILDRGLVDEVHLIEYPILLGGGTPLFTKNGKRRVLDLIDSHDFGSGATLHRYRFKSA